MTLFRMNNTLKAWIQNGNKVQLINNSNILSKMNSKKFKAKKLWINSYENKDYFLKF